MDSLLQRWGLSETSWWSEPLATPVGIAVMVVFLTTIAALLLLSRGSPPPFVMKSTGPGSSASLQNSESSSTTKDDSTWRLYVQTFLSPWGIDDNNSNDNVDEDAYWLDSDEESDEDDTTNEDGPGSTTHFLFLVHGHRGMHTDLSYMRRRIRQQMKEQQSSKSQQESALFSNSNSTTDTIDTTNTNNNTKFSKLVVHAAVCNEGKTDDGVEAGGERLVEEIVSVIRQRSPTYSSNNTSAEHPRPVRNVTVSLLGNSLGGLYARYAVGKLKERCMLSSSLSSEDNSKTNKDDDDNNTHTGPGFALLDQSIRLHWNIFCTTATPHLGLSGHTFVSLPRSAQKGVAALMGPTGRDFFRLNSLLYDMGVRPEFLQPLSQFRRRTCYANAFGTDFPVPASTAAFLDVSSAYPHHVVMEEDEEAAQAESSSSNTATKTDDATETVSVGSDGKEQSNDDGEESTPAEDTGATKASNSLVVATLRTPEKYGDKDAISIALLPRRQSSDRVKDDVDAMPVSDDNSCSSSCHESSRADGDDESDEAFLEQELSHMSQSLDSLGWKKVFIDMRKEIPRIGIPRPQALLRRNKKTPQKKLSHTDSIGTENSGDDDGSLRESSSIGGGQGGESSNSSGPLHTRITPGGILESKDVAEAVLYTAPEDELFRIHWPMGHNMMVAFSRSRFSAHVNRAGRPIVDTLAKELVHDILLYETPTTTPEY